MSDKKKASELAALHVVTLMAGKALYKQADAALEALLKQKKPGDVVAMPIERPESINKELWPAISGKKFIVVDKFAKKNSIGVGLSARRFELEESKQIGS